MMGELRWLAHSPEQINQAARTRVKDLTRYDSDHPETILGHSVTVIRAGSFSGLLFVASMVALGIAILSQFHLL